MTELWIDHVVAPVPSLDAATAYEKLGLRLSPVARHAGRGTENRVFFAGGPRAEFYVELLAVHDPAAARATSRGPDYLEAIERGGGASALMLATDDLDAIAARLRDSGHDTAVESIVRDDGRKFADVVAVPESAGLGITVGVIAYPEDRESRQMRHAEAGLHAHDLDLRRLDHLAAMAPELDATTAAWESALGIAVHGEIEGTGMLIRQLKIGDAILELLGPAGADSPLAGRPPGLASMCAWEVGDLDAAVAHVRAQGFTSTDPAPGVIPNTRVARLPAEELAGVGLQLLAYL